MTTTLRNTTDRVRAAIRLGSRVVFEPNDGGGSEVYIEGEHAGTIDAAAVAELRKLQNAALLAKASTSIDDLVKDGGMLNDEQAQRFKDLVLDKSLLRPGARVRRRLTFSRKIDE